LGGVGGGSKSAEGFGADVCEGEVGAARGLGLLAFAG